MPVKGVLQPAKTKFQTMAYIETALKMNKAAGVIDTFIKVESIDFLLYF